MPTPSVTDTPLLALRDLCLAGHGDGPLLLDHISAAVSAGDRIALSGGSGAGKSLLLRTMALLEIPGGGELLWRGQAIARAEIPLYRSQVIYLHQRPALGSGSVADCLRQVFNLKIHRGKQYAEAAILDYLADIGLDRRFLDKHLGDLSGGEAQIAALLRAIQLQPQILLLDEPTAALDAGKTLAIEKIVGHWHAAAQPRAYVWISHNPEQSRRVADQTWSMDGGRLRR